MPAPKMPSRRSSQVSDHVTRTATPGLRKSLWFALWAASPADDVINGVFSGIKHEWQVNGLDDIQDRRTLAEKLGGNVVVSLEGKPI